MRPVLALAAALAVGACSDAPSPTHPMILEVTGEAGAGLTWILDVELDRAGAVEVEYQAPGRPALLVRSPSDASTHRIVLTRLRAGTSYESTVRAGGAAVSHGFTTRPLPEALRAVELTASGTPSRPLTLLELTEPDGYSGFVVVDAEGAVVWHFEADSTATGATRLADGNFVFLDPRLGLAEVAPDGRTVSTLPRSGETRAHHDVIATPDGSVLFLALEPRLVEGETIVGEAVWEWTPGAAEATKRWSSFDHLSTVDDWAPRSHPTDWLHANALHLGPRGNLLVSLQRLNQVVSIAPGFDGLEWRLGGINATIPVPEGERFSGQHTAAEVAPDRVLLFDNGLEREEPFSRAVEFDIGGAEARNVWEFRPERPNWSRAVSSARRLPNGNTMVGFGLSKGIAGSTGPIEVYEAIPPARWCGISWSGAGCGSCTGRPRWRRSEARRRSARCGSHARRIG